MAKIGRIAGASGLALGGNVFGWTADEKESFAVLDRYVDSGGNLLDSADAYYMWAEGLSGGESETILGRWLASRQNRDRVIIVTKVGMWDQRPGLGADNIRSAVEDSLRRLHTEYIDVYFAHKDDPTTPQEETLAVFTELVKEGKVREIGRPTSRPIGSPPRWRCRMPRGFPGSLRSRRRTTSCSGNSTNRLSATGRGTRGSRCFPTTD